MSRGCCDVREALALVRNQSRLRCLRWALAAACAAAVVGSHGSAHASEKIGFLELAASGVPEAAAAKFGAAIERGMRAAEFDLVSRAEFTAELKESSWVEGCTFGPCMGEVYDTTKIPRALIVRVQGMGSSYTFIASLVDTQTGVLLAQAKQDCPACTIDDAEAKASQLGSDLAQDLSTRTKLSSSEPVDDQPPVEAGKRRLSSLRTVSYVFIAAAVGLAGAGAYFVTEDHSDRGIPLLAGGGASLVGGVTMMIFSRSF